MTKVLEILRYPDPRLRVKAEKVREMDDDLRQTASRMLDLMYGARGVGLAATQVGVPLRFFVMDLGDQGVGPEVVVNPVIESATGEMPSDEGCLSFPDIYAPVPRAEQIVVRAMGLDGRPSRIEAAGLRARVVQHEMDHLDGVLLVDRMNEESRRTMDGKLKALDRAFRRGKGR